MMRTWARRALWTLGGLAAAAFVAGWATWAMLPGLAVRLPAARSAAAVSSSSRAPHCLLIKIDQPSGPAEWVKACGTGAGGESWVRWGAAYKRGGPLVVDGAYLRPGDCPRSSPCVVLWPGSPQQ